MLPRSIVVSSVDVIGDGWADPVVAMRMSGRAAIDPGARGNLAIEEADTDPYGDELFELLDDDVATGDDDPLGEAEHNRRIRQSKTVPVEAFGTLDSPFRVGQVGLADESVRERTEMSRERFARTAGGEAGPSAYVCV